VLQIHKQVDKEFSPPHRQRNRLIGSSYGLINRQVDKELLRSHTQRDYLIGSSQRVTDTETS
jgi:hypothetical protein